MPLSPRLAEALAEVPRHGLWVIAEKDGTFVTYDRMSEIVNDLASHHRAERVPLPVLRDLRHRGGVRFVQRGSHVAAERTQEEGGVLDT